MSTPIIDIATKCKSRTEYDTVPPSESIRLQIGEDPTQLTDIALRGALAGKMTAGRSYQVTITDITPAA